MNYRFDAIALEVKRAHFCRIGLSLIHEYLKRHKLPETLTTVHELAQQHRMTVTRTGAALVFRKLMKPLSETSRVDRASGDAICEICEYAYRDHPPDAEQSFLNVLCNGRRVKL